MKYLKTLPTQGMPKSKFRQGDVMFVVRITRKEKKEVTERRKDGWELERVGRHDVFHKLEHRWKVFLPGDFLNLHL
jgi:hypothetical protein